ncbi:MAG: small multidrug export protein [Firmicutes bacterium]|nr:small multidrug export protein [Bacillota bacterium]
MPTIAAEYIHTMVIAMTPVLELRGAIPYGLAHGLPFWPIFVVAVVGNVIPVPFLILFIRPVFAFLRRSRVLGTFIERMERRAHLKGRKVNRYKTLGLFILVAIPLPGTGAWTGALVAAFLDIRMRNALLAITLGVLAAGIIVSLVSYSAFFVFFR